MEAGEGGGFGWGGVEGWGENADNCNWITIRIFKKLKLWESWGRFRKLLDSLAFFSPLLRGSWVSGEHHVRKIHLNNKAGHWVWKRHRENHTTWTGIWVSRGEACCRDLRARVGKCLGLGAAVMPWSFPSCLLICLLWSPEHFKLKCWGKESSYL